MTKHQCRVHVLCGDLSKYISVTASIHAKFLYVDDTEEYLNYCKIYCNVCCKLGIYIILVFSVQNCFSHVR